MTAILAFAVAVGLSWPLIAWRNDPSLPWWTAGLGSLGAGALAMIIAIMAESVIEDVVKAVVLTAVAGILLAQGIPVWMTAPLVVGPWVGFVANRNLFQGMARQNK